MDPEGRGPYRALGPCAINVGRRSNFFGVETFFYDFFSLVNLVKEAKNYEKKI